MPWPDAARGVCLEDCGPVRPFPVRPGRRMAPGWWWSATDGRLVRYGSGVMRTQMMLLDRDPSVVALACRPVELTWRERDGACVRHAPHLMVRLSDGTGLLADCAGREELSQRLSSRAAVMETAAEAVGWQYRVLRPPDPVMAANLGWLAGYRHPRYGGVGPAGRVAEAFQLRAEGHEIRDEDIARLSPLKHKNLNVLGRYSFTPSTPAGGLRPLRDPDAVGLDEDDDGTEE